MENSISYDRRPALLSDNERKAFLDGDFLDRVSVFLGKHSGNYGKGYNMQFANISLENGDLIKRYIFSIKKLTGLICIGGKKYDGNYNKNPKLTQFYGNEDEIKFSPNKISGDRDVSLNLNYYTKLLDGSIG